MEYTSGRRSSYRPPRMAVQPAEALYSVRYPKNTLIWAHVGVV